MGDDAKDEINKMIYVAARYNDPERVEECLKLGADPMWENKKEDNMTPWIACLRGNNLDCACLMAKLSKTVDIDVLIDEKDERSPLIAAAEDGHMDFAWTLLELGCDITIEYHTDGAGMSTALKCAQLSGARDMTHMLEQATQNENLYNGAHKNDMMMIEKALQHKGSLEWRNPHDEQNRRTAIMAALLRGNKDACERLVKACVQLKANFNIQDSDGETAMTLAIRKRDYDMMDVMLKAGMDPNFPINELGCRPLHVAVLAQSLPAAELLISWGARYDVLYTYAEGGEECEDGATPEEGSPMTPEQLAKKRMVPACEGYLQQVSINEALVHAARAGDDEAFEQQLDRRAEIEWFCPYPEADTGVKLRNTALIEACQRGHTDMAVILVEREAPLDYVNSAGFTAMLLAAKNGHVGCVNALLATACEEGIDLEVICGAEHERTALLYAAAAACIQKSACHRDCALALTRAGGLEINVNVRDSDGMAPMDYCCQVGDLEMFEQLLARGAEFREPVSPQGRWPGRTPLMAAAAVGQIALVQRLLDQGFSLAQLHEVDGNGHSAKEIAALNGEHDVVHMIEEMENAVRLREQMRLLQVDALQLEKLDPPQASDVPAGARFGL